ncbi:hypothetical protein TRVL_04324 [Trypanosoma vivax]|nr:hypothetical protein TRVL_04324 [Trypanosoma vivax]
MRYEPGELPPAPLFMLSSAITNFFLWPYSVARSASCAHAVTAACVAWRAARSSSACLRLSTLPCSLSQTESYVPLSASLAAFGAALRLAVLHAKMASRSPASAPAAFASFTPTLSDRTSANSTFLSSAHNPPPAVHSLSLRTLARSATSSVHNCTTLPQSRPLTLTIARLFPVSRHSTVRCAFRAPPTAPELQGRTVSLLAVCSTSPPPRLPHLCALRCRCARKWRPTMSADAAHLSRASLRSRPSY